MIRELNGAEPASAAGASKVPSELEPPVALFNGTDLTGWTIDGGKNAWTVAGYELQIRSRALVGRGMLKSVSEYSDFLLSFEARLSSGTDAGVTIRHKGSGKALKVNLLVGVENEFNRGTGSLWWPNASGGTAGVKPATRAPAISSGEWSRFEIDLRGRQLVVRVDGVEIQRADLDSLPESDEMRHRSGAIGFQTSSSALLSLRNIQIQNLASP